MDDSQTKSDQTNQDNSEDTTGTPMTPPAFSTENVADVPPPIIQQEQTTEPATQESPEEKARKLLGKSGDKKKESKFKLPSLGGSGPKGKMIATILGVFLLLGAVAAGVVLVQRNQDVRERAAVTSSGSWTWNGFTCNWSCDSNSCSVSGGSGSSWSQVCYVAHYVCPDNTGGGQCNNNGKQSSSESFEYSCGKEQIDVSCQSGASGCSGSYASTISRTGTQVCQIPCKICGGPNDCDNNSDPFNICVSSANECNNDADCGGGPTPTPTPTPSPSPSPVNAKCDAFSATPASYTSGSGSVNINLSAHVDTPSSVGKAVFYAMGDGDDRCSGANWTQVGVDTTPDGSGNFAVSLSSSQIPGFGTENVVDYHANIFDSAGNLICTGNAGNDGTGCNNNNPKCLLTATSTNVVCNAQTAISTPPPNTHDVTTFCDDNGNAKVSMTWNIPGTATVADIAEVNSFSPHWKKAVASGATQSAIAPDEFIHDTTQAAMPPLKFGFTYYTRVYNSSTATFTTTKVITTPDTCGGPTPTPTPTATPSPTPTPTGSPTPPPVIGGLCIEVKAYAVVGPVTNPDSWVRLTPRDLRKLQSGDDVYFTVAGLLTTTVGGAQAVVDMARFSVNETIGQDPVWITSTNIKPAAVDPVDTPEEYYYQYTIPVDQNSFVIHGQVHDPRNNTWF